MYTAIHTWSFRDKFKQEPTFNIRQALDISAEMGFTGMEIMTGKASMPPEHIGCDTAPALREVMQYAKKVGVRIHCYATYNDFAFVKNEEWRLANIEYIKTWLRLAGETGVPNIRMLTGYYAEGQDRAKLEDLTRKGIEECIPVAEKAGVNMAIENHNSIFFTGREIVDLIKSFGSKRLTACPDPSNGCNTFFEPTRSKTDEDGVFANLAVMAPKATDSHLKIRGIDANGGLLGWDLDRLVKTYQQAGYDGPITFESIVDGDLLAPLAQVRKLVDAAIHRAGKPA